MTRNFSLTSNQVDALADSKASSKPLLRQHLLAQRRMLDQALRMQWDAALVSHLLAWWQSLECKPETGKPTLGVYWPLRGEPDLSAGYAALAARGVQLCLPVVQQKNTALRFAHWQPGEAMSHDQMGVAVPLDLRFEASTPTLLIPCLGFSPERFRLGYGGGFYDRTLAQLPRPNTIGIAYACQAVQFASDAHDVALDQMLTETGFSSR